MGDIHLGSPACDEKLFRKDLEYVLNTEDCYCICTGDALDGIIHGDPRFVEGVSKFKTAKERQNATYNYTKGVIDAFRPIAKAGKLLGIGCGNHEDSLSKRTSWDVANFAADELGVPYLGYSYFYRLTIQKENGGLKRNYVIYGHHGWGGGRKKGTSLNKLIDSIGYINADLILMGHDHQKIATRVPRIGITTTGKPRLKEDIITVARVGTYLKTYLIGKTTYSEKHGYQPTDLGHVRIDLRFGGHHKELEVHVSE